MYVHCTCNNARRPGHSASDVPTVRYDGSEEYNKPKENEIFSVWPRRWRPGGSAPLLSSNCVALFEEHAVQVLNRFFGRNCLNWAKEKRWRLENGGN